MATRMRLRHQEDVRSKIQATKIIQRLEDCALGTLDMTREQIAAAKIILGKTLPDLSATSVDLGVETNLLTVLGNMPNKSPV